MDYSENFITTLRWLSVHIVLAKRTQREMTSVQNQHTCTDLQNTQYNVHMWPDSSLAMEGISEQNGPFSFITTFLRVVCDFGPVSYSRHLITWLRRVRRVMKGWIYVIWYTPTNCQSNNSRLNTSRPKILRLILMLNGTKRLNATLTLWHLFILKV